MKGSKQSNHMHKMPGGHMMKDADMKKMGGKMPMKGNHAGKNHKK